MRRVTYLYLWLRNRIEEEAGSVLGEYGFLFVAIALVALAGLMILGGNLQNFFGSKIANYFK